MTLETIDPQETAKAFDEKYIALQGALSREKFPPFTKAFEEDKLRVLFEWENSRAMDLPTDKKKQLKSYCAARDGFICTFDNLPFSDFGQMDVHHINEKKNDWHRWNICLVSHGCNASFNTNKFNEVRKRALQEPEPSLSQLRPRERENRPRPLDTDPYSNRKNFSALPSYRKQLFCKMFYGLRKGEVYTRKQLNVYCCLQSGAESETGLRYLSLMVDCDLSPFEERKDQNGEYYVYFRLPEYEFLSVDSMLELFPIGGLRFVDEKRKSELMEYAREQMETKDRKAVESKLGVS